MKWLIAILFIALPVDAKQIRVAVIDTGYNIKFNNLKLCADGHKDFTGKGLNDVSKHGQNISHIIEDMSKGANYCQIIIKFIHRNDDEKNYLIEAIAYAHTLNVDIVNISAGGTGEHGLEKKYVIQLLDSGVLVVVAAGNGSRDLDKKCNYFPACYDERIIVAGNMNRQGTRHWTSNYGSVVDYWPVATDVIAGGIKATGTSQGAALVTGSLLRLQTARNITSHDKVMVRKVSYALYKQFRVDKKVDYLKDKYVTKKYQRIGTFLHWGADSYIKQEYIINFKWRFK